MKSKKSRLKRGLIITGCTIAGICILIIVFISPIAKYLIEKYSVKYTGRQIKMNWAYVNPFTGYVHFNNFRIYEAHSDTVFFSSEGLSAGINLHKLLSKEYEITSITLNKPIGIAIQRTRDIFNFTDIINRFSSPRASKPAKSPARFSILNIKINDGTFYMQDTLIHINYFIKHFDFESAGKRWDADTFPGTFAFSPGMGSGKVNGNFNINTSNLDYLFNFTIVKFNLSIIEQYLKDMTNYGTFSAYLNARLKATGNFKDGENIDAKGRISVNDFHFGKSSNDDYLSFDTLALIINEINPQEHFYHLDSLTLAHPCFKYEKYDYLDNIETMFGKNGTNVAAEDADPARFNLILALAHFFANISKNFFHSEYKINRLAVTRADIKFNDFSTNEKFSIDADPLYIRADSVDKSHGDVKISLQSQIKPYGNMLLTADINPRDSANFDLTYHLGKIPITLFNPYLISFTSFPLDRGTIELNGAWTVRNGFIQSENHLLIIDPRVTKRVKNKASHWIPLWVVMALARERSNVIDYQIPISGNLRNPTFHLSDIVFNTLNNIFVKPVTTPYRLKVQSVEDIIEKSLTIQWETHHTSMTLLQEKFVGKMANFMAENPSATVAVYPELYAAKEKEYILFFAAKKKYYLVCHPEKERTFNESDSEYIDKMSVKDSEFVHYLNKKLKRSLVFTIQEKCSNIVDSDAVNTQFNLLCKSRENLFLSFFKEKGVAGRVTFVHARNIIPYNGFSFYRMEYKGDIPDYLMSAYKKIDELNNETPREKYEKERKKIKSI
jgi:Domain of Unknown Function (DUF748)